MDQRAAIELLDKATCEVDLVAASQLLGELERLRATLWARVMTPASHGTHDELLTVPQVAQRLKLSAYRVYELVRQGHLKAVHLGKAVRIRPSAVADYLAKLSV